MAAVNYKRLFEVQLLHEYYLTDSDETTVFHDLSKKEAFISKMFDLDAPSISSSLEYHLPAALSSMLKDYQLHLVATYTGFAVLTQVSEKTLDDGTTVYAPAIKLPDNVSIPVLLSPRDNTLRAVTNTRFDRTIAATYFFTNQDTTAAKTFPVLTAGVPAFDAAYPYELGQLYTDGAGKVGQYYLNGNKAGFLPVDGKDYASTSDELLVPLQFIYRYDPADKVTKAHFELRDRSGQLVRSFDFGYAIAPPQQPIDVRSNQAPGLDPPPERIISLPLTSDPVKNIYTLTATVNDSKKYSHSLIFCDGDELTDAWGMVAIFPVAATPGYSLYAADGFLRYRKDANGVVTPAPVFEVRIKSRLSWWRYINDRQGVLKADAVPAFLARSGTRDLASLLPRAASALPRKYTIKDNNGAIKQEKYLPNPESDGRLTIEGGKFYSDILVPKSDMFPLDNTS